MEDSLPVRPRILITHPDPASASEQTVSEIRSVVRQLIQAIGTRDRVLLEKLLRPDYVYINDGERYNREQCLSVTESQTAFELLELEPIKVIVHGDEATVNYIATGDGTIDGRPIRGMFRIEQKMICEKGKWQIAATRTHVIAPLY